MLACTQASLHDESRLQFWCCTMVANEDGIKCWSCGFWHDKYALHFLSTSRDFTRTQDLSTFELIGGFFFIYDLPKGPSQLKSSSSDTSNNWSAPLISTGMFPFSDFNAGKHDRLVGGILRHWCSSPSAKKKFLPHSLRGRRGHTALYVSAIYSFTHSLYESALSTTVLTLRGRNRWSVAGWLPGVKVQCRLRHGRGLDGSCEPSLACWPMA